MSVQIRGGTPGVLAEVEANTLAMRVVQRPDDIGSNGHYSMSLASGVMAAALAANAEVFQFRFAHVSNVCLIRRVRIWAGGIAAFTAGVTQFSLWAARAWTADGSGGTAGTLTTNNAKLRTSFATTSNITARIASTAALTAGTKTLDAQGLTSVGGSVTATAGDKIISPSVDILDMDDGNMYPLTLINQEGFVIRATVPATGTWSFGVDVHWVERTAY